MCVWNWKYYSRSRFQDPRLLISSWSNLIPFFWGSRKFSIVQSKFSLFMVKVWYLDCHNLSKSPAVWLRLFLTQGQWTNANIFKLIAFFVLWERGGTRLQIKYAMANDIAQNSMAMCLRWNLHSLDIFCHPEIKLTQHAPPPEWKRTLSSGLVAEGFKYEIRCCWKRNKHQSIN